VSESARIPVDEDKTQLSTPQSLQGEDPDATVKTEPLADPDKTVPTSQSALAENSASEPSHGSSTSGTGPTRTVVRQYQRNQTGDLEIGSVLRERLLIAKLLGSGGMRSVSLALDFRNTEAAAREA